MEEVRQEFSKGAGSGPQASLGFWPNATGFVPYLSDINRSYCVQREVKCKLFLRQPRHYTVFFRAQALGRGGEGCPKAAAFLAQQNQRRQEAAAEQIETLASAPCGGRGDGLAHNAACAGCSRQASCQRISCESPEERASGDSHSSDVFIPS